MKVSAVVALLLSSAGAMNLRAESLAVGAPATTNVSHAHQKRITPSDLDEHPDLERAERIAALKSAKDMAPEDIEKTLEARELEHRKRMKGLEEDLKEEVDRRKVKKDEAKGTLGKQMDLIKEEKKKVLDKVRQQEKALEEDDAVLHEEKNFLKGEQELLKEEMSKIDKSAQAKDEFGEFKDQRTKFLRAKMDHNEKQIKYNKDRLTDNLEKQKALEDDLYHGVHDRALEKRILDKPLVTDEKKEDAKEEEKEEAKEEEKKEERKESKFNNANKDLVTLLAKVGWWTGVWKQETPLHPYDLPMFEGDMVTLNDDGTFTSKGSLNVADGTIWFNLVDGSLNLKRAQEPAEEPAKLEGLSNDYYMTYNHHETAQVKRMQDGEEFTLRREKDEKGGDVPEHETHLKAISDGVWKTLRSESDLTGEWRGDFWGGDLLVMHNNGRFMIDEPANIFDGEIWVNLKDHTLNLKRHAIARERLTNDHYGTQDAPDHVEIVKQQNGSKKQIKKIRGFVPTEQI